MARGFFQRLFGRGRRLTNADIQREIDFHLDDGARRARERRGADPGEARRTALLDFGGVSRDARTCATRAA